MSGPPPLQGTKRRHCRGRRDVQHVIDAAMEQGWKYEPASGGNSHAYLVPPRGVPVGISSTPSDGMYEKQIVRQMRKSGFTWPVHKGKGAPVDMSDIYAECRKQGYEIEKCDNHLRIMSPDLTKPMVTVPRRPHRAATLASLRLIGFVWNDLDDERIDETAVSWVPVPKCSAYEFSDDDRIRNKATFKELTPNERGHFVLTDDKGKLRHFSLEKMRELAEFTPPTKETPVTTMEDTQAPPSGEPDDQAEPQGPPIPRPNARREIVLIEGVKEGYEVDEDAVVYAPPSRKFPRGVVLNLIADVARPRVRLAKASGYGSVRTNLDEIVLKAFEAKPGPHWYPEHIDGNPNNCALSNLRWAEGTPSEETPVDIPQTVVDRVKDPIEKHLDRLDEMAVAARRQREDEELAQLKEADGLAAAEQHVDDYTGDVQSHAPVDRAVSAFDDDDAGVPLAAVSIVEDAPPRAEAELLDVATKLCDSPYGARAADRLFTQEHVDQAKNVTVDMDLLGGTPPIRITSSHVYTDEVSGLSVHVYADGNIGTPAITLDNLRVVQALLSAAKK